MKCTMCGKEITNYNPSQRPICNDCRAKHEARHEEKVLEYIRLKNYFMIERAIANIERHPTPMGFDGYAEAIETVTEYIGNNPDKFESTPEILVAIECMISGIKVKSQYAINGKRIDLCLPDEHILIEVDGSLYHSNSKKDMARDKKILDTLPQDWVIVRLPTDFVINNRCNIVDAIFYLAEGQRKIRGKYGTLVNFNPKEVFKAMMECNFNI